MTSPAPCGQFSAHGRSIGQTRFNPIPSATASAARLSAILLLVWLSTLSASIWGNFTQKPFAFQTTTYFTPAGLKEPIGVTQNHPFWSVDRNDFVQAASPAQGMKVREWIGQKSFREQFEFSVKQVKEFGGTKYLPPNLR